MKLAITHRSLRYIFIIGIVILLGGSIALFGIGWTKVKILPFDNKSEFQIILNMPEGSALEKTAQVVVKLRQQ
jgi:multidrug efflux pump subunit AcrB